MALAVLAPAPVQAESITQLECLQWLTKVCGDSGQFSANSTAADYVQWARTRGVNPTGGIQPNALLTREALAQILVQLLGINPNKRGGDYVRIIERELGVSLPSEGDLSRASIVSLFDDVGFQSRSFVIAQGVGSPQRKGNAGRGNGEDPPPPGWNKNPRNPHFGQPEEPGR